MKKLLYFVVPFFLFSCIKVDEKKETSSIIKNSESDDITFIIDLKINQNTNEDIEKRFKSFDEDIKHWNDYDYILINKNLEVCFKQIEQILKDKKMNFNYFPQKAQ